MKQEIDNNDANLENISNKRQTLTDESTSSIRNASLNVCIFGAVTKHIHELPGGYDPHLVTGGPGMQYHRVRACCFRRLKKIQKQTNKQKTSRVTNETCSKRHGVIYSVFVKLSL